MNKNRIKHWIFSLQKFLKIPILHYIYISPFCDPFFPTLPHRILPIRHSLKPLQAEISKMELLYK